MKIKMDEILKLRKRLLELSPNNKISVNDLFIKGSALAIKRSPDVNTQWLGDSVRKFNNIDISVAVSTDTGLITPIIFDADKKGLVEISKNMKELADKAKNNKLKPQEFQVLFLIYIF